MRSKAYDAIYLAPHLDDAVLSCGGQIVRRIGSGERVLVVTCFAGREPPGRLSPFARRLHWVCGLHVDAIARRRSEDCRACHRLGAAVLHLEELEAIYRRDPRSGSPLYASQRALFDACHAADGELLDRLAGRLAELSSGEQVVVPLAVGGHVDHQLVRAAAERAIDRLTYYEDYPYVERSGALHKALGDPARWRSCTVALEESHIEEKLAAIASYHSQIQLLFLTSGRMTRRVRRYVRSVGGERLWCRV